MLINREKAIAAVEANYAVSREDVIEALRALPVSDGVTDEMVERARQAWLEKASDYELLEVSIRAALEAALGPLPAPPAC